MDKISTLRRYGLFDAKVPRYTSYPPANRFQQDVGARFQSEWLKNVQPNEAVSVYIHIPFCRRLCWFCACRTQGTRTLSPVEGYVKDVIAEIASVTRTAATPLRMARLHLGGGTPTLLSPDLMERLLDAVFDAFDLAADFEFSVEIDPTEAAPELLSVLARRGMKRASIGVQDFNSKVQKAIGRLQSFEQTHLVCEMLRSLGVNSLNVDLLYGLPHQTAASLSETLDRVVSLHPDRLALYGYAHVPHVSKRQAIIPTERLPDPEARFHMSEQARARLEAIGYDSIGIDHFARRDDNLALAARRGVLRRNFQGYTDDTCQTLIGLGASAISKFREGYCQNAVSTSAYRQRVQANGMAGHKGYRMEKDDDLIADLVEQIMCKGRIDLSRSRTRHQASEAFLKSVIEDLLHTFPDILCPSLEGISICRGHEAATRLIAAHLDASLPAHSSSSAAI